jgi:hypothetical protein
VTLVRPPSPAAPLRITVVGSSAAMMVTPGPADRTEGTYGEVLGDVLTAAGVPTQVSFVTRWFGMIHELRHEHERVRDLRPHVVVVNVGLVECQPHVLPTGVVRHFTTWDPASTALARWYRRAAAPPLWRCLRAWQRFASSVDRHTTYRLRPARFRWEVDHLTGLLRNETGALVLLVDIDPPGQRVVHWLPGLAARVDHYNAILAAAVTERDDPLVRLVPASRTVTGREAELIPDGIHRMAAGHRLTANLLAEQVIGWLADERLAVSTDARAEV